MAGMFEHPGHIIYDSYFVKMSSYCHITCH